MHKIAFPHLDLLMSFEKDDQFRDLNKKIEQHISITKRNSLRAESNPKQDKQPE
jgi:hypothetical protein